MLTQAIVLAMSLKVPDSKGHLNYRKISQDGADAIVLVCNATSAPTHCASVLVTLGFRESGFDFNAKHDHDADGIPRGCGAWGVLCSYPHATWKEQVQSAWSLVVKSAVTCQEPLALYASGSCYSGRAVAREYMRIARKIALEFADQTEHDGVQ